MSFILDALKKSENARQRQIGPAMAELPRRRRQNERPVWLWPVIALLVVNIGVLVLVLLRKQGGEAQSAAVAAAPPAPIPAAMQQPIPNAAAVLPPPAPIQVEPAPLPVQAPPRNAGEGMVSALAEESTLRSELDGDGGMAADPEMAQAVARAKAQLEQERQQSGVRPIQAPAVAPLASSPPSGRAAPAANTAAAEEVLPTVNELAASGRTFPPLRLDIHSFADKPADRFVFVNMRRYNEGQTLQEGPAIERITADGVILNQQGLRFLLPRP